MLRPGSGGALPAGRKTCGLRGKAEEKISEGWKKPKTNRADTLIHREGRSREEKD